MNKSADYQTFFLKLEKKREVIVMRRDTGITDVATLVVMNDIP